MTKLEANRSSTSEAARADAENISISQNSAVALWGIGHSPWLWGTRIRILFVVDGRITDSKYALDFGLGWVLETLSSPSSPWWVRPEVTLAGRDDPLPPNPDPRDHRGPHYDIESFRFTQNGFDINAYDQIWFFGDWPGLDGNGGGDEIIEREEYRPLDDAELLILAEWMEHGGGVFATGDHSILGASMCHRIPRVRTMRRWRRDQGVPTFSGPTRNETLVQSVGREDDWEGDGLAQRIFPVAWRYGPPVLQGRLPHPILCGRSGVIEHFPDHMHEGGVFEEAEVRLDDSLNISGYAGEEYPTVTAGGLATTMAFAPADLATTRPLRIRPRPQVIAYGLTSHLDIPRRFPMISVYDGSPIGFGRVVVDSTWHHWFSMNLHGFLNDPSSGYYAGMQDYYRNIVHWMCTPEQRTSMLFAATWGALVGSQPGAFDAELGVWGLGVRVVNIITRSMSQCFLSDLVGGLFGVMESQPESSPRPEVDDWSRLWTVSSSSLNTLMVGGIAICMLEQAHHHINERAHGRETKLDSNAIRRLGLEGVAAAKRELAEGLAQGSNRFLAMRDLIAERIDRTGLGDIPIDHAD